jgi:hypothetical protein
MGARKLAVTFGAAAALALGVTVPVAVAAQADAQGSTQGTKLQPPTGKPGPEAVAAAKAASEGDGIGTANSCWYDGKWWCNNVAGAPIYDSNYNVVGHVETNPSIFVCRAEGGDHGGTHPTRWEYTQADDTGAWGWMSDNDISSETDPLPVC